MLQNNRFKDITVDLGGREMLSRPQRDLFTHTQGRLPVEMLCVGGVAEQIDLGSCEKLTGREGDLCSTGRCRWQTEIQRLFETKDPPKLLIFTDVSSSLVAMVKYILAENAVGREEML